MFKRISKLIKGDKEQPPEQQAEHNTLPSTPSVAPASKPTAKDKPDLWSWGLLTGTYSPLPDDADDQRPDHAKGNNKS